MWPVLFTVFGVPIQSFGVSKLLAVFLAALILGRSFERLGYTRTTAYRLVLWATVWGFVGAKVHFLVESEAVIGWSTLGGAGFNWYGGLIGGTLAVALFSRLHGLRLGAVAGAIAVPLSLAYGIGQIGCFLAGDGSYGRPTDLPWALPFPNGVVPVDVPVHPASLYETAGAFLVAAILWTFRRRLGAMTVFGTYLILSGLVRLLVELVRADEPVLIGLSAPQVLSAASIVVGLGLIVVARRRARRTEAAIRAAVALGFGALERLER